MDRKGRNPLRRPCQDALLLLLALAIIALARLMGRASRRALPLREQL